MKPNIIKTLLIVLIPALLLSCRKDDEDTQPDTPEASAAVVQSIAPMADIPDAAEFYGQTVIGKLESQIVIPTSGNIKDISKMYLELNLSHSEASDLVVSLTSPDGTEKKFIYRVFTTNEYSGANTLVFNNTFENEIPTAINPIPAGNYKQSVGFEPNPPETIEQVFSYFSGKQIQGTWILKIKDMSHNYTGKLHSWKLRFDEGALY